MGRLTFAILLVSLVAPVFAQSKHPLTFEDMMALKRISEPNISPDGKWVLFAAVEVNLAANTKTPHVWAIPTAGGQAKQIISNQDADRPRWAPDGAHFAFISSKEGGSQVWIADFDGSVGNVTGVHKLTSIATEADGELWSPDGKNILFASNVYPECDGDPANEQECNARKLDEASKSKVKALVFTHLLYRHWNAYKEGKRSHLFVVPVDACVGTASAVRPGEAGQSSASADNGRAKLEQTAAADCSHAAIPLDLTPGDYDTPPFSLGGQDDYAFSPDGQEICYTSNHDRVEAISTNNDLFTVSVNGGAAKKITDNPASDSTPLYSPDGKYIAYRAQVRPGYESDRFRLMLYNRRTGHIRNLTESFDQWVNTFTWAPDSSKIYFVSDEKGDSPVYSIVVETETIEGEKASELHVTRGKSGISTVIGGYNDDLVVTRDGKNLLFTRMSVKFPNEIFRFPLSGPAPEAASTAFETQEVCTDATGKIKPGGCKASPVPQNATQLTHLNDADLSQVAMAPFETFWFTGAAGDKVEGFLLKPPNFEGSKKYPLKFILHGGPEVPIGDDWSYRWNSELFAASGYVVILINFHGSPGYGQKFIDAINGDWGGAPFEDLMKGLDYAEQHYPFIDKDRECALGASYGGYMANWILGHTNRFKCIVSHDGPFNNESAWGTTEELWFPDWEFKGPLYSNRELYRKWSPHLAATNFKTPTLVVHGQLDYRVDVSEGLQLFTTLQRLNVPSKMLYFPDEGHWVLKPQNSRLWYQTVNGWVDQWTKK
jgi:dipeptidyl aminopeptidase/acylaminoacyl peptidase